MIVRCVSRVLVCVFAQHRLDLDRYTITPESIAKPPIYERVPIFEPADQPFTITSAKVGGGQMELD